jgi:hypothetical protein
MRDNANNLNSQRIVELEVERTETRVLPQIISEIITVSTISGWNPGQPQARQCCRILKVTLVMSGSIQHSNAGANRQTGGIS